jgi:succinyl-diaminopimelate desuccinylase
LSQLTAGVAENAVPSSATLRLKGRKLAEVTQALGQISASLSDNITVTEDAGEVLLVSHGKSGHAAFPENTQNAIPILLDALVASELLSDADFRAAP